MQRSIWMIVVLGLVLPSAAWARVSQDQIVGRSADCIVDRGVGAFDIPVHPEMITALYFPGTLEKATRHPGWQEKFAIQSDADTLYVRPLSMGGNTTANLVVETAGARMRVNLFFHVTAYPHQALQACRFVARDAAEAEQGRGQTPVLIKERLLGDGELVPMVRAMRGTSARVSVRLGRALYHDGDLWTTFFIENQDWQPLRLANVQVANKDGTIIPLRDVILEPPARPHADAHAEVPVGHRAAGIMRLPGLAEGVEPREITFTGFTGARMVVATAEEPIWVWVPRREDQVREELRRERAERAAEGVVTLSLQSVYGAIWLGDGAGLDQSDATSLQGLGVRATYALGLRWAVEGELLGASTGEARFRDVMYDGMQGDLTRSAALGRISLGGLLRFGDESYIPMVRAGVALQGASHAGTLATATGDEPGPDAFEWTTLATLGVGLDVRLGALLAGVALSVMTPWGDYELARRSFEAGIHLGYAWKP